SQTYLATADAIPAVDLRQRPIVLRRYASLLTITGRLDEARAMADALCEVAVAGERGVPPEAEALAIKSRVAAYIGDDEHAELWADRALAMLGQRDDSLRADLALNLGWTRRRQGDLVASSEQFDRAARLGRTSGEPLAALWGTRYLALDWLMLGRLDDADVLVEDELARVDRAGSTGDFARAALLVARAEIAYERNTLEVARAALDEAIAIARQAADAKILANAYGALAWLERAHGGLEAAHQAAFRAQRVMDGVIEDALLATIAVDRGNLPMAQQWAERSGMRLGDPIEPTQSPLVVMTYARVHAASGASRDAIAFLERAMAKYAENGWLRARMQATAMLATIQESAGMQEAARSSMADAVRLAVPEGFVRSLLDAGPLVEGLLRDLARSDRLGAVERQWALQVVTAPGGNAEPGAQHTSAQLVEALTERQREILVLLADGRSNREIATSLFLAEGTVKAHVHQIYGKLMARNRVEAIANARRFGLIDA
ncbi:MAG: LuxR C-terminal-related transcriptional regulator, partial [Thermomicrobiales bacterium]